MMALDDRILEHPKFLRAAKFGGSDAVHLWLGLRAFCSQNLTDGWIAKDLFCEVRGPRGAAARRKALTVLVDSGLVHEHPEAYELHDFLDWAKSRESVLAERASWRERQRKARSMSRRDSPGDSPSDTGVSHARVFESCPVLSGPDPDLTRNVGSKDLPGSGVPEPPVERADDSGESACPWNLEQQADAAGIPEEFAKFYDTTPEAVSEHVREFIAYWTIGEGMGKKRRGSWLSRLRQRLKECGQQKRFPPLGRAAHESRAKRPARGKPQRRPDPPLPPLEEQRRLAEQALRLTGGRAS